MEQFSPENSKETDKTGNREISRRRFLKAALLTAAGLALTPRQVLAQKSKQKQSMENKTQLVKEEENGQSLTMSREALLARAERDGIGYFLINFEIESGLWNEKYPSWKIDQAKRNLRRIMETFSHLLNEASKTFSSDEQIQFIRAYTQLTDDQVRMVRANPKIKEKLFRAFSLSSFYEKRVGRTYQEGSSFLDSLLTGQYDCNIGTALIAQLNQITQLPLLALMLKRANVSHMVPILDLSSYDLPVLIIESTNRGEMIPIQNYKHDFPESQFTFYTLTSSVIASICKEMAEKFIRLGNVNTALQYLHKVVELEPNHYSSHIALALGYLKAREYGQALNSAIHATELNKKTLILIVWLQSQPILWEIKNYLSQPIILSKK